MADPLVSNAQPPFFTVGVCAFGAGFRIDVADAGRSKSYVLPEASQQAFAAFYRALSSEFGTRLPDLFADQSETRPPPIRWRPLLTECVDPRILCGYGDPDVVKTGDGYWLFATSNDAPDAFPILHSADLDQWEPRGFVFPHGREPQWTAKEPNVAAFWAPEMIAAGDEYWLCFTARQAAGGLAIGLARSASPAGPWIDNGTPLAIGDAVDPALLGLGAGQERIPCGVIDPHLFCDTNGDRYLFWKEDRNGLWPRPLAMLLRKHPPLIDQLFAAEADRRTAAFAAALVGWANAQPPMIRFFAMHPLIGAVLANRARVRRALAGSGLAPAILDAMTTPIGGLRIAGDGRSLVGEAKIVLVNDLEWEGHLVEAPFVARQDGHYWLFYSGNDFSTPSYGIGAAVADHPLGPYAKQGTPLLTSTREWTAPGHASVAPGLDGRPQLFFHAFRPGTGGYNAFRALLTVGLKFDRERVDVVEPN